MLESLISKLRRIQPGQRITARFLNQPIESINSLVPGAAAPGQRRPGSKVSRVQRFKIVSVGEDALTCNPYKDGAVKSDINIKVAKPYLLRASLTSRAGINYTYSSESTREADDGTNTEDQIVVPSYAVDDDIYAVRLPTGGTGVADAEWLDQNYDARKWARKQPS